MTDEAPTYKDRCHAYVPEGLRETKWRIPMGELPFPSEVAHDTVSALSRLLQTMQGDDPDAVRQAAEHGVALLQRYASRITVVPLAMAKADELNRDSGTWWWARTDEGEPEGLNEDGSLRMRGHWSHFSGHYVPVHVEMVSWNRRDVNGWKGRDDVRAGGEWRLFLHEVLAAEGHFGTDPWQALMEIHHKGRQLRDGHGVPLTYWTREEYETLVGRKIYYLNQPALITSVIPGRIVIAGDPGPLMAPWRQDPEEPTIVTELLDPHLWWWRD